MAGWERKYSDQQRRAVIQARLERGLPAKAVSELAARGELVALNGDKLEPFEIPEGTVYSYGRNAESRRRRAATSTLADQPAQDAVEEIRRRLVAALDHETMRLDERRRRKPNEPSDAEQLRKCARALRELAAMPAPGERGRQPGRPGQDGGVPAGESIAKPNSMAGKIEASLRPRGFADAAQDDATPLVSESGDVDDAQGSDSSGEQPSAAGADGADERINGGLEEDAGSYAREQTASLRATAVEQR